jgi:multiple sugar transport system ATP-binding protein
VDVTEELGSEVNVIFRIDAPPVATEELLAAADEDGEEILLMADEQPTAVFTARVDARTTSRAGDRLTLTVDPARFHFFDPETGLAIDPALEPAAS